MSLHYEKPILLIEFDQNKSFSLQSVSDMKENIVLSDLSSKLVLLTLAFTKLRIIWSSSPHETAAVFKELKVNKDRYFTFNDTVLRKHTTNLIQKKLP